MTSFAFTKEGTITADALHEVAMYLEGKAYKETYIKEVAKMLSVPMTEEGMRYGMYVYLNIKL